MVRPLVTPRLVLRGWRRSDVPALAELFADPRFSWSPFRRARTPAEAREFVARTTDHWYRHGVGRWAVCERESGLLLGYVGVTELGWPPRPAAWDLGWRIAARWWGRGMGTEAARAAVADAFARTPATGLVATTEQAHLASRRVCGRLGMRETGHGIHPAYGVECVIAELDRSGWRRVPQL